MINLTGADEIRIRLNINRISWRVFLVCLAFAIGFVVLDLFVNFYELSDLKVIRRFCNIAREDSLASWFSSTQTFVVGMTLWLIFFLVRRTSASALKSYGWFVIACFFTYMAVDDGAEIHERLGTAFEIISERAVSPGASLFWTSRILAFFPSYPWQILFVPVFAVIGLFTFIFLWQELKTKAAKILIILALTCFVTAVGLDFIEGLDKNHKWNIHTKIRKQYHLKKYTVRHFFKSSEEFLEMMGITLFWIAFIQYFKFLPAGGICFFIPSEESMVIVTK